MGVERVEGWEILCTTTRPVRLLNARDGPAVVPLTFTAITSATLKLFFSFFFFFAVPNVDRAEPYRALSILVSRGLCIRYGVLGPTVLGSEGACFKG